MAWQDTLPFPLIILGLFQLPWHLDESRQVTTHRATPKLSIEHSWQLPFMVPSLMSRLCDSVRPAPLFPLSSTAGPVSATWHNSRSGHTNALYPGLGNMADRLLTADSWEEPPWEPLRQAGSTHTRSSVFFVATVAASPCRPHFWPPFIGKDSGNNTDHLHDPLRRLTGCSGCPRSQRAGDLRYQTERWASASRMDVVFATLSTPSAVPANSDQVVRPLVENTLMPVIRL
ncbi:hypothetical protein PG985_010398 [Apiospora marii]|uniref:uncharacterized protein n=1 Tax=Apiospora marii TaxID=335849 RepID=UPI003131A9F1